MRRQMFFYDVQRDFYSGYFIGQSSEITNVMVGSIYLESRRTIVILDCSIWEGWILTFQSSSMSWKWNYLVQGITFLLYAVMIYSHSYPPLLLVIVHTMSQSGLLTQLWHQFGRLLNICLIFITIYLCCLANLSGLAFWWVVMKKHVDFQFIFSVELFYLFSLISNQFLYLTTNNWQVYPCWWSVTTSTTVMEIELGSCTLIIYVVFN